MVLRGWLSFALTTLFATAAVAVLAHHTGSAEVEGEALAAEAKRVTKLVGTSPDPSEITLFWPAVAGAVRVEVRRDGRLIDVFPASWRRAYTDRGLWKRTRYEYSVRVLGAGDRVLADFTRVVRTRASKSRHPRLFADWSFINRRVPDAPDLEPDSARMVAASITRYTERANFSNNDHWGIPVVMADAQSPRYEIGCTRWWCDRRLPPHPIPAFARPSLGSDHHLAVIESQTGRTLDMWLAERTARGWRAGLSWMNDANGSAVNCRRGERCGGATVAGFALAAGVVRPEEIAQGHIDHALVITTPHTRSDVTACPATDTDGRHDHPHALPIGTQVQLDPALDVSALDLPHWQATLARAMQRYGAYVVDTGGSLAVRAESNLNRGYDAWRRAGVTSDSPSLRDFPWHRLRVLKITPCS